MARKRQFLLTWMASNGPSVTGFRIHTSIDEAKECAKTMDQLFFRIWEVFKDTPPKVVSNKTLLDDHTTIAWVDK